MKNSKNGILNSVNVLTVSGLIMLFAGIVCNEWFLAAVFSPDGIIEDPRKLKIWLAEFFLVIAGMTCIAFRNRITRAKIYVIAAMTFLSASFLSNERWLSALMPLRGLSSRGQVAVEMFSLLLICIGLLFAIFSVKEEVRKKHRVIFLAFSGLICLSVFCVHDFYLSYMRFTFLRKAASGTELNIHVSDEHLGWTLKPGSRGTHSRKGDGNFNATYEIGENGFRKVDNNTDNADFSIYFFGDSYTFGVGVDNKDAFPNIIKEKYLKERINVFNAGVMAYGIVQMFQRYLNIEDRIRPSDLVVFTPIPLDIERNIKDFWFPYNLMLTNVVPAGYYPFFENGAIRYHKITDSLYNKLKVIVLGAPYTRNIWRSVRKRFIPDTTRESTEMIDIIRKRVEMKGAKFLLIFLPQPVECERGRYLVDVSGFAFSDIMKYFPSEKAEIEKIQFNDDKHWNSRGHGMAAEGIVKTLLGAGLISRDHLKADILEDRTVRLSDQHEGAKHYVPYHR